MTNRRKLVRWAVLCVAGAIACLGIVVVILLHLDPQACRLAFITQAIAAGESPSPPSRFTGVWRTWHKNGRLASEYAYAAGQRRGAFTVWYPNGRKAETGSLLKSIPYDDVPGAYDNTYDGSLLRWYPDGRLKERATYRDGVLDGRYESWDNFDQGYWKRKDENYRSGKLHGICVRWDPQGTKTTMEYIGGQRHGWGRQISEVNGDMRWEDYHEHGVGKIYRKYHDGKLIEERRSE